MEEVKMENSTRKNSLSSSPGVWSNLIQRLFSQNINEMEKQLTKVPDNEMLSCLPLQMTVVFNILFFPFWIISTSLMLNLKYDYLSKELRVILMAAIIIFSVVEAIRLYLGFVGNMSEKVPELAGFLLLTLLPQTPVILFLLFYTPFIITPLEYAVHPILVFMIFIEILTSVRTVKLMARQQATKYHLQQFVDLEKVSDNETDDYVQEVRKNSFREKVA